MPLFRSTVSGTIQRKVPMPTVWSQRQRQLREQLNRGNAVIPSGFFPLPNPVVSSDGTLVASVSYDGHIGIWNTATGRLIRVLRGFSPGKCDNITLVFSPDGRQLVVNSGSGEIALWDVALQFVGATSSRRRLRSSTYPVVDTTRY